MGKIDFEIKEENFVQKYTDTYNLSILVGVDRFSFLVSDPQENLLLLRSYALPENIKVLGNIGESIKDIYINDEVLKQSFHQVKIAILNQKSTLVPTELFDGEQKEIYLENVVQYPSSDTVSFDHVRPQGLVNVYAANTQFITQLYGYFPAAKVRHASTGLLFGNRKIAENRTGRQVFINVREGILQISLFDNKELLFHNSFTYQTSRDFIYYVMLVFDQFGLKPETNTVHISGQIVQDSEIYHLLYRYIRHLEMVPVPSYYKLGKKGNATTPHHYFDLYSLKLCE